MLPQSLSVYLDLVRFVAAMVVFIGHVSGQRLTGGLFWQVGHYLSIAVTIFFVLSGFVISYITTQRETSWRSYVISRAARVYSVALPAIVLTLILDAIGRTIRPDLYSISWGYSADAPITDAIVNLLFMSQLWSLHISPGSAGPFWSLVYEAWYYVIFGLAMFAPRPWRYVAPVIVLAFVGPKIALLFPLWLFGVVSYRLCLMRRISSHVGLGIVIVTVLMFIGYDYLSWQGYTLQSEAFSDFRRTQFPEDILVAAIFAVHLVGFYAAAPLLSRVFARIAAPIQWMAGATFSIYLLHLPVAQFLRSVMPTPAEHWMTRVVVFGGTLFVIFCIASITERRKEWWRRGVTGILSIIPAAPTRPIEAAGPPATPPTA